MASKALLGYRQSLDDVSKRRYDEKCALIDKIDPYLLDKTKWSKDINLWASVTFADIFMYLVNFTSVYTVEELKCYKGLQAYNQFISGWVRDVAVYKVNDLCLHTARVMHSQRLTDTPLTPWIIIEPDGKVLAAHCNCMAGLGECCTHVAALLYSIEATVLVRNSRTVTEEKAYWLPASVKGANYKTLKEIDFTSARTKKKTLDNQLAGTPVTPRSQQELREVHPPTEEELTGFLQRLSATGARSVILSVKAPFQKEFIPTPVSANFPLILTDLFNKELLSAGFSEIMIKCKNLKIEVSDQEAANVESATKEQSKSKLWNRFRSGRVTASKMFAVCRTNPAAPSKSLISSICYPTETSFKSVATSWVMDHEHVARTSYKEAMELLHDNFSLENAGFTINPDFPTLGASPDGLVACDCCGIGVVEIKCPYSVRQSSLNDYSCLEDTPDGKKLKTEHQYYYQVQTQMFVTKREFCDFVVWTEQDMHIERIEPNDQLWQEMSTTAKDFHSIAIMPELVGKFYSHPSRTSHAETRQDGPLNVVNGATTLPGDDRVIDDKEHVYCICQQPETPDREMVACENENCKLEWFHLDCLKLTKSRLPKGKWYCPDCKRSSASSISASRPKKRFRKH
ncbi:uncharacterized protein LOC132564723 [Ylistrum balloti]|uniref:uncharacterized protein LOC132564723 n=1 Tax=Ylistrum balloti TaxID=509963 RepID=UPI002905C173|nr:uncharacterized protein LOC132564723 [Ylistrum balloti]